MTLEDQIKNSASTHSMERLTALEKELEQEKAATSAAQEKHKKEQERAKALEQTGKDLQEKCKQLEAKYNAETVRAETEASNFAKLDKAYAALHGKCDKQEKTAQALKREYDKEKAEVRALKKSRQLISRL